MLNVTIDGIRLQAKEGMTILEAAQSVGKSRSAVANSLRLLNLCPYVMELLARELGIPMEAVTKNGGDSTMVIGRIGEV